MFRAFFAHHQEHMDCISKLCNGMHGKKFVICAVCVVELLSSARYDEVLTRVLCVCVCDNPGTNTELRGGDLVGESIFKR